MAAIKQIIFTALGALFAYFFPEMELPLPEFFQSFAGFAPLVLFLAAFVNTKLEWRSFKAWLSTIVIGIFLAFAGYFFKVGLFAEALLWHVPFYGIGAAATAISLFTVPMIKAWLETIFNYEWKRAKE